jgi:hypothetical protein
MKESVKIVGGIAAGIVVLSAIGAIAGDSGSSSDTKSSSAPSPKAGSYDPDAHDGLGLAEWTTDPMEAMRFSDQAAALARWKQTSTVRPLREDGKPNRPLTAVTVSVFRMMIIEPTR